MGKRLQDFSQFWGPNSFPFCFNITNATRFPIINSLSLCVYVIVPIGEAHLGRDALWEKYMWEHAQGHFRGEGYGRCLKRHARGQHSSLALAATNNQWFVHKTNFSFYIMTKAEKKTFLHMINKLKTPTNYVGSLKTKVQKEGKLLGLKSHDYHILM